MISVLHVTLIWCGCHILIKKRTMSWKTEQNKSKRKMQNKTYTMTHLEQKQKLTIENLKTEVRFCVSGFN